MMQATGSFNKERLCPVLYFGLGDVHTPQKSNVKFIKRLECKKISKSVREWIKLCFCSLYHELLSIVSIFINSWLLNQHFKGDFLGGIYLISWICFP